MIFCGSSVRTWAALLHPKVMLLWEEEGNAPAPFGWEVSGGTELSILPIVPVITMPRYMMFIWSVWPLTWAAPVPYRWGRDFS